ncbi:MAG: nitroreductase family protein [Bacteroidales bacterium]|nr:nitroreductase family protein [Bacteroidales bacterium]
MADNYLEYRQEELEKAHKTTIRRTNPSLDTLLHRNRSYRGYDISRKVTEDELKEIVSACTLTASGMNRQPLRFRLVCGDEASKVLPLITLGGALPEEGLPKPGTEPRAFIVACSTVTEDKVACIDLGFCGQSMLLKATSMGLGGIFILNFRKNELKEALGLPLEPLAVIAIGKPAEEIYLMPTEGPSLRYYRKNGVHFVPKLTLDSLIIKKD